MIELQGKYTAASICIDEVEDECISQINHMINHPAFTNKVVIMPDTHAGKGSVIGFTMPLSNKIIPNVIGVDIGCGMLLANIGEKFDHSLAKVDSIIQKEIPMGFSINLSSNSDHLDYNIPNRLVIDFMREFNARFKTTYSPAEYNSQWLAKKLNQLEMKASVFFNSLGSLGGGNHFIEIGKGEKNYYLTIHSGSRNFGLKIAEFWQKIAINNFCIEKPQLRSKEIQQQKEKNKVQKIKKPFKADFSRELAYLEDDQMMNYLFDMIFAQYYASLNRKIIMQKICKLLNLGTKEEMIESVHNYVDFKDFVIRKGAISSYLDQMMIIPFNMRDGLLICKGRSNKEWNYSAPHGAGRIMSRSKAKQKFGLDEFKASMKGIYSTSIKNSTIDEAPFVYKDSAMIEKLIQPTAEIVEKVKPVLNIKSA